jgi:hypothetical protein
MNSPINPDGQFNKPNGKPYTNEKALKKASNAHWYFFIFFILEVVILFLNEWLVVMKTIWPITPIIPESGDPAPAVRDSQQGWQFALVNFMSFGWLAPIMIMIAMAFWRHTEESVKTICGVFNVLALIMLIISFGTTCYLWQHANDPQMPDNIFNDPFYCCAYFDVVHECPNFGTDCGATLTPDQLITPITGVLRFTFELVMIVFVFVFNLLYYYLSYTPAVKLLLYAECKAGFKYDLTPKGASSCEMKYRDQTSSESSDIEITTPAKRPHGTFVFPIDGPSSYRQVGSSSKDM